MEKKPAYMSMTVRGLVMIAIVLLNSVFEVDIKIDDLLPIFDQIAALVGSIMVIIGRARADKPLSFSPLDESIKDAVRDEPDPRDFPYQEVFGNIEAEPVQFPLNRITIYNQGKEFITRMACTRYGLMHINNGQNIIEYINYSEVDPKEPRLDYLEVNPGAEKEGATLQSTLHQIKGDGYISGWTRVNKEKEQVMNAIDRGTFIYTGSYYGDWKAVKATGQYKEREDKRTVGHAFCIVDYTPNYMYAINSYGPEDGVFTIDWKYLPNLFTMYAIVDERNATPLEARKAKLNNELEKLIEKVEKGENIGITGGLLYRTRVDPNWKITKSLKE